MTIWNEAKPAQTDKLSEYPSTVTQNAVAFREGIEKAFMWTVNSGTSAGEPIFSSASTNAGAARAFFGPQSSVSTSKDGRLMVTSDTSRLYAVPHAAPVLLGTRDPIIADTQTWATVPISFTTITAGSAWLVQSGVTTGLTSTATGSIVFAASYASIPRIMVGPIVSTATVHAFTLAIPAVNGSGFSFVSTIYGSATSFGFYWRSEGTVAL